MDATGDQDLKLQKSAPELIDELRKSLPRFLWKSRNASDASTIHSTRHVRPVVQQSKTNQLLKLLDPFQEWPQLLDPHLSDLLQPLVSAFTEYLCNHASSYHKSSRYKSSPDMIPLPRAVCQILYVFCKVRGQKVIVRFLNNEPRFLEPMLDALETWAHQGSSMGKWSSQMLWQERFIILWWLSHLMLAPFDLTSMSSNISGRALGDFCTPIVLPTGAPPIARRLVHVSTFYLGFASKEKEAAGMLLTRLTLKPDMQSIDLHRTVVESVLSSLNGSDAINSLISTHAAIGLLSFLTRFLTSSERHVAQPLLLPIYRLVQRVKSELVPLHIEIMSSALARKLLIKISRTIAVGITKIGYKITDIDPQFPDDALEELIGHLIDALEDKDTSVRTAASKALSLVVMESNRDVAGQIVGNLIENLVIDSKLSEGSQTGRVIDRVEDHDAGGDIDWVSPVTLKPDLRAVNAVHWHGLVLTLSQLLFRKAIPLPELFMLIERLLPALQFEQRSPLGASVGTNVRDAACFGLWSLARRYTTTELSQAVFPNPGFEHESTLQPLANDLLIAALMDPAGNIRRGASAALQEMIGRHPDRIKHGINLVQIVDYHAVALRSSAMSEVAVRASEVDETYWDAILDGLLGWRGIKSSDAQTRRQAADTIGRLTFIGSRQRRQATTLIVVRHQLGRTPLHETDERHGLLLTLASVLRAMHEVLAEKMVAYSLPLNARVNIWHPSVNDHTVYGVAEMAAFRRRQIPSSSIPSLVLEGICRLISATASSSDTTLPAWFRAISEPSAETMNLCIKIVNFSLDQADQLVIEAAADAAANIFRFLKREDRDELVEAWVGGLESTDPSSGSGRLGRISVLGAIYRYTWEEDLPEISGKDKVWQWLDAPRVRNISDPSNFQDLILDTLLEELGPKRSIETRCAALKSLASGVLRYQVVPADIPGNLLACLRDYTITEKGDVGSLVRMEAIDAVRLALGGLFRTKDENQTRQTIIAKLGALAVEKLDKVRWRAWNCVQPHLLAYGLAGYQLVTVSDVLQTSSVKYFRQLLFLTTLEWARKPFLEGFVTSAGTGSETLVQASRSAFVQYAATLPSEESHELCMAAIDIFMENAANERLIVPTMEFLVFLFDAHLLQALMSEITTWRCFFKQLEQTHYKSKNMYKIEAAVKLYAALARFDPMRKLALKKLCQMLRHAYLKIRIAAAESLIIVTEDQGMMAVDWSKSRHELKGAAEELQARLGL